MDWTTVQWLWPLAVAAVVTLYGLAARRPGWCALGASWAAIWLLAMAVAGVDCPWEGFEGPLTTLDGKLPWECRASLVL